VPVAIGLDGDCDVAAMTYAPGDCPDDLLASFAGDPARRAGLDGWWRSLARLGPTREGFRARFK